MGLRDEQLRLRSSVASENYFVDLRSNQKDPGRKIGVGLRGCDTDRNQHGF